MTPWDELEKLFDKLDSLSKEFENRVNQGDTAQ